MTTVSCSQVARPVTLGGLDLDDLGSVNTEQHGAVRRRYSLPKVENTQATLRRVVRRRHLSFSQSFSPSGPKRNCSKRVDQTPMSAAKGPRSCSRRSIRCRDWIRFHTDRLVGVDRTMPGPMNFSGGLGLASPGNTLSGHGPHAGADGGRTVMTAITLRDFHFAMRGMVGLRTHRNGFPLMFVRFCARSQQTCDARRTLGLILRFELQSCAFQAINFFDRSVSSCLLATATMRC